ncbi:hypothetical protein JADG_007009 [Aureobasidium aubasidani]|nr:hypothetical protein JADG_007009 [Aureobasidium pullulans]
MAIKPTFATLPPELHLIIYEYLFLDPKEQKYPHALLEVSRKTLSLSAPILLRHLKLYIEGDDEEWYLSFARQDYNSWHRTPNSVAWEVFRQDPEMQRLIPHVKTIHFEPASCLDVVGRMLGVWMAKEVGDAKICTMSLLERLMEACSGYAENDYDDVVRFCFRRSRVGKTRKETDEEVFKEWAAWEKENGVQPGDYEDYL